MNVCAHIFHTIIRIIILYSLHTLTHKPALITSSVNGKDARFKGGPHVPDDGWKDMFCLMVVINLFDVFSTAAVADSVRR